MHPEESEMRLTSECYLPFGLCRADNIFSTINGKPVVGATEDHSWAESTLTDLQQILAPELGNSGIPEPVALLLVFKWLSIHRHNNLTS